MWAQKNGRNRKLGFEEWYPEDDGDGNANVPQQPHLASKMEVWGNYELSDGDMLHGWIVANRSWNASKPDFEARVHGDGMLGDHVSISCTNKPRANATATYWCKVVPDTAAFRTLRKEIQERLAWPKMLAKIRAEVRDVPPLSNEDHEILKHLVQRLCLNPSHVFAMHQILDKSCITALIRGAGTGKPQTLVACIKAVLWQQGLMVPQNPDPANLGTCNTRLGVLRQIPHPPRMCASDCTYQCTSRQLVVTCA